MCYVIYVLRSLDVAIDAEQRVQILSLKSFVVKPVISEFEQLFHVSQYNRIACSVSLYCT